VLAYSKWFELKCLADLARVLPRYRDQIEDIKGRLWDPLPVIRAHVYHLEFRGSYSLKAVLPALAPEMTTLIPAGPPHLARYARHPRPQGGEGGSGGPVEVIIVKNYEGHRTSSLKSSSELLAWDASGEIMTLRDNVGQQ